MLHSNLLEGLKGKIFPFFPMGTSHRPAEKLRNECFFLCNMLLPFPICTSRKTRAIARLSALPSCPLPVRVYAIPLE